LSGLGGKPGGGGKAVTQLTPERLEAWKAIFSRPIPGGPTARGFHTYFGTDVPNWPPYCFIENDRTLGIPSALLPKESLEKNQASFQGPAMPGWDLAQILPALTDRACRVIEERAKAQSPFLLYFALTSPHTPIAVAPAWRGRSALNHSYADFVMQTDATVGRVLDTLAAQGVADRTLVVFTSDNGFAAYAGARELEAAGHYPSGPLRGYKASIWEGGHRVPFILRWPGVAQAGAVCGQTVGSVDLIATLAQALGVNLPPDAGEDSVSLLPLFKRGDQPVREGLVHQAAAGGLALRSGRWKLIFGDKEGDAPQLFDLEHDLAEKTNLASQHPEEVARLTEQMKRYIRDGRSTPGERQVNDVPVRLAKRLGL
jgi:arylsulfatase A-like enzyme